MLHENATPSPAPSRPPQATHTPPCALNTQEPVNNGPLCVMQLYGIIYLPLYFLFCVSVFQISIMSFLRASYMLFY